MQGEGKAAIGFLLYEVYIALTGDGKGGRCRIFKITARAEQCGRKGVNYSDPQRLGLGLKQGSPKQELQPSNTIEINSDSAQDCIEKLRFSPPGLLLAVLIGSS